MLAMLCCVLRVRYCLSVLVYAGLSLFIISGPYLYLVVCVLYAHNLALKDKQDKDTNERKVGKKVLLDNIKASIEPILKSDYKSGEHIGVGAQLKHLQEEVKNYLPPTVNKKHSAAVSTNDTFGDLTLGGYRDARHVHFASTPVKPEVSNINLATPPCITKEETIAESLLQNTMQTLASEFKHTRDRKIQKFRGGTSSGALLVFKSWM